MKILLLAIGSRGDVQPFVALGRALRQRGHTVALAAPTGFAAMAGNAGLAFHPLPVDFQSLLESPVIQAAMKGFVGKLKAYRWANDIMNDQLTEIWKIGLDVAPDLILNHFKGALAPQLARRLGGISIPVMLQPGFMPTHDYPQFLIASRTLGRTGNIASHRLINALTRIGTKLLVKRWSRATGIDIGPAMDPTQGYHPDGLAPRLHAYSPTLVPRPDEWPPSEIESGYLFTDPEDWSPPSDLSAFLDAGDAPIYAGFGSMPGIDHARVSDAFTGALARTGLRAVVATGWGGLADVAGDNVHVLKAAPHSWLFPRVAAVVHHGGSGTTHEGLRWGRPSIICPLFGDQPFFGARVHALGAGPAPIRQKHLTVDNLARALDMAMTERNRRRAKEIGARLGAEDGIGKAVDLVESCAGTDRHSPGVQSAGPRSSVRR